MNREKLREAIKVYSTNNRYVQPKGFDINVKEGWTEYRYQEFLREYRLEVSMGSAQAVSDSMIESDRGDLLNQLKQDVEDEGVCDDGEYREHRVTVAVKVQALWDGVRLQ